LLVLPLMLLAACGSSDSSSTPAVTLTSISMAPSTVSLHPAETQALTVTAHYSDGSNAVVSTGSTFATNALSVATVNTSGLVTAVAVGKARITATVETRTASATVTVLPAPLPLFTDNYGAGLSYAGFGGSTGSPVVDTTEHHAGTASLRIDIPTSNYTGGAIVSGNVVNVSAYNAITFWAKTENVVTGSLDKVGYGNDTASTLHQGEWLGQQFTGTWTKYALPLGGHSKLTAEKGLFHFARGSNASAFKVWLDDIQYEYLDAATLGAASPAIANETVNKVPTDPPFTVGGTQVSFNVPGNGSTATVVILKPDLFDWTSSSPTFASVDSHGVVTPLAVGTTGVTASLDGVQAAGTTTVVVALPPVPLTLPPVPTVAAANVISLYSSVTGGYNGTAADMGGKVDTWLTCWSGGTGGDPVSPPISVGGSQAAPRKYMMDAAHNFVGIEFLGKTGATSPGSCGGTITTLNEIDVSTTDHFHIDVWTPDDASNFQVKLVDAGANGLLNGQDTAGILTITAASNPPLATGTWLSYDVPLSAFSGLAGLKNLGQMVLIAPDGGTVYVDNIYFYKSSGSGVAGPALPPAAPAKLPADVISLFSSAYTGTAGDFSAKVDSYHASCFGPPGATVADYTIPGSHALKQYTLPTGGFGIIELIGLTGGTATPPDSALCGGGTQTGLNAINATAMTRIHFDVWSPGGSTNFQVHLVNGDVNGYVNQGPGAPGTAGSPTNFASGANPVAAGAWTSFDIDLSTLGPAGAPAGLTKLGLVKFFSNDAGTFFIDNVYFWKPPALPPFSTITFDNSALTYTLTPFGGEAASVVADPLNAANNVAQLVRPASSATWAGTTVSAGATLGIPFTATKKVMTAKVYSPDASTPVMLKVEDSTSGAICAQAQATTTTSNAWETLTFDFSGPVIPGCPALDLSKNFDRVSVFPNFNAVVAGDKTYLIDDVAFVP
jgi:hypothetical protein